MRRTQKKVKGLTHLGAKTAYADRYDPSVLETFVNKHRDTDYWVTFTCPEFTSLCPVTGQPDFATITVQYVPDVRMVESNHGDFHEDCVNVILKDLRALMEPKYIEVSGRFHARGGITIDPYVNYGRPGTRYAELAAERFRTHDGTRRQWQ